MSASAVHDARRPSPWSDPRLVVPSAEAWEAMSEAERAREEERIMDVLDEYREAMSEGTPHSRPKHKAYQELGDHFGRAGRKVFLATELAVLYPGHPVIVPDLLAVMDVADPERERNTWRVIDERRGIDLVLEFRNQGKKHKDLVENVAEYADLGITEYFSYDAQSTRLRGWRLSSPRARVYTQLVPQGGLFPSFVLDLELGVTEGRLRFFKNLAMIPTSEELVGRLQKMTDAYQDRLEEAERRRQEAERLQQDTENRRQEAEHRRQEAERLQGVTALRLESARRGLAAMILRRLQEQGLAPTDAQKAQITSCEDVTELLRWVDKASSATTVEDLLAQQ